MKRVPKKTHDGSYTWFVPELNEHFHSIHGAEQESKHVFVEAGLNAWRRENPGKTPHVLEVGLGSGLNLELSYREGLQKGEALLYTGMEPFPPNPLTLSRLQELSQRKTFFSNMYQQDLAWQQHPKLQFRWVCKGLQDFDVPGPYDIVYFDAFAPEKQPELWTETNFARLLDMCRPNSLWVSYCAKGSVKRALKAAGWEVEALPGPPGKREMTRARKPA